MNRTAENIKNNKIKSTVILLLSLILILMTVAPAFSVSYSDKKVVRMGYFPESGMMDGAEDGSVKSGYVYEYIQEMANSAGWKYEYVYGTYTELYQMLLDGEIDMLPYISWSEERSKEVLFPDTEMGDEQFYIGSLSEKELSDDLHELEGKKIGTSKDTFQNIPFNALIKEKGINCELVEYTLISDKWDALVKGEVDYTIESSTVNQTIDVHAVYEFGDRYPYYVIVAPQRADLLEEYNHAQIDLYTSNPAFVENLKTKYFSAVPIFREISDDSSEWLSDHKSIVIGTYENMSPYIITNEDGSVTGIYAEQVELALEKLDVKAEIKWRFYSDKESLDNGLKNGEVDTICPYYHSYNDAENDGFIISNTAFKSDFSVMYKDKYTENTLSVIAATVSDLGVSYVKECYPDSEIITCNSGEDCLENLKSGKATCIVMNTDDLTEIYENHRGKYSIKTLETDCEICFAALPGDSELISIFNKGFPFISDIERNEIQNRFYVDNSKFNLLDYLKENPIVIISMLAAFFVIIVVLYINSMRKSKDNERRERENQSFRRIIDGFSAEYEAVLLGNLNDGTYSVLSRKKDLGIAFMGYDKFTEAVRNFDGENAFVKDKKGNYINKNEENVLSIETFVQFIDERVHPDDRKALLKIVNADYIRLLLTKDAVYEHNFTVVSNDEEAVYKLSIIRGVDENSFAFALANITEEYNIKKHHLLGAIPLSDDILYKANIGLWAFELDEGKPPRMYVDKTMLGLIGLEEEISPEDTYHAWYDHIDEGSYGLVSDAVDRMIRGEHAEVQYPWHHPNGKIWYVRCGGIRNPEYTNGVRIEGTHQNVTEVIHFEEERIAEQAALNRYFLDSYESAYYISLDTLEWQTYKRTENLKNNYPTHENYIESLGRYIDTEIHLDDREQSSIMIKPTKLKKILETQSSLRFTFRRISGGQERLLQCEIVRGFDENHIAMGFRDVTEEERAKKEYEISVDLASQQRHIKAFGDMINAALWSIDINSNDNVERVYWSDEFRHKFGFENTDDFPNTVEAWSDRLHPEDKEVTIQHFWKGIKSKETDKFVYDIKYRILRKNNEYCWYHAVGRMEEIGDGERRMYGVIRDISADKKLEEQNAILQEQQKQLEEALAMAQAADKAKTDFLFNMSHDIRTPMNAIVGFTNMAQKHIDDKDRVVDSLEKTKQSSDLLLSLINSILDMSRIESGKATVERDKGDATLSFINIESTMSELAKSKDIDISFEIGEIKDRYVYYDHNRCLRIFVNIISNAIKYTQEGGKVAVKCEQVGTKDNIGTYRYTFVDNGIGMSEEFQKHVFEEFSREYNSTTSGIQGTGLGLAVCKSFTELMGGTIECRSKQGVGTVFTVTIPFELREATGDENINTGKEFDIKSVFDFKGKKILLVEDNELNREIATDILVEEGIDVEKAEDGSIAVEMLKEKGPDYYDLILMDIQMPVMSGYDATKAIRVMYPNSKLPIIALSANAFAEDKAASIAAGMNSHVAKPINIEELLKTIQQMM